jgi:probable rRNA maturation factor
MKTILVNQSSVRMPKKFIEQWLRFLHRDYVRQKARGASKRLGARAELVVVFLDTREAKALNKKFRGKNYATDVLSFSSDESSGELVLCPQVLLRQAREHGLTFRQELAYMLSHGVLHLLGYDHELSRREADTMFALQDKAFARGLRKIRTK